MKFEYEYEKYYNERDNGMETAFHEFDIPSLDDIFLECLFEPQNENSTHLIGKCPFCEKDRHFYIHKTTNLWDCKVCGMRGNVKNL
jgi:hypothetical protein